MSLMHKFLKFLFIMNLILPFNSNHDNYKSRLSVLNIGLDYSKFSSSNDLYRSLVVIPFFLEKKRYSIGFYLNPFSYEEFNSYGDYKKNKLIDSYLLNIRFRYIPYEFKNKSNFFIDLAHTNGELYNWKNLKITWLEFGLFRRLNYASKISFGYKLNIDTNSNIKMNGFFINLIFGYSFLKKK